MLKRLVYTILFTLACTVAINADVTCDEYRAVSFDTQGGTVIARSNGCNWSLRAVPEPEYEFEKWSDDSTDNPRHITITPGDDTAYTVGAVFRQAGYTKTILPGKYGTAAADPVAGCLFEWRLSAAAAAGSEFTGWSDGNTDNPRSVTLASDDFSAQTFVAEFTESWCSRVTVTYGPDAGGGTVSAAHCNCEWYLRATPSSGYTFTGWTDGCTDNPRVAVLDDPSKDSFDFRAQFVLTANLPCDYDSITMTEGHGVITAVKDGCNWTLTVTPDAGWEFTEWSDDHSTTNPRVVTLSPNDSYVKYKAIFTYVACKPFRAVYDAHTGGTVSASRTDCSLTLTATPDAGYEFDSWSDGSLANPHIVTIDDPSAKSLTFTARFRPFSCNYNTSVLEGFGTIRAEQLSCDPCSYRLTAEPSAGYEFIQWSDAVSTNPRDVTIDISVDPDTKVSYATYTAQFEDFYCRNVRDVHTDCDGGTIVASRRKGCEWLLTAVPANSSYEFTCWSDGHTGNPRIIEFERESTESFELSANFASCPYYTVLTSGTEYGTITATQENASAGCEWTLTVAPKEGWEFSQWSDGSTDNPRVKTTNGNPFDISAEYTGTYSKDFRSVITNPVGGGSVTVENCNYSWTMIATPDTENGYQFAGWEDGSITNPRSLDIDPADPEQEYSALFLIPDGRIDGWLYNGLEITTNSTDILDGGSTARANLYADGTLIVENAAVSQKDYGRWMVTFNLSALNEHAGELLQMRVFDACDQLSCAIDTVVPIVITNNTLFTTLSAPDSVDVQVVRGVLTIDRNAVLKELDIYADAQVSLPAEKTLSVQHVYMRGDGPVGAYPKFSVNGSLTNANLDTIYYDYKLDYHAYYPLAIPYTVACNKIRTKTGHTPMYEVSWYNGDDRALNETGWTVYDDLAVGASIKVGEGYSIFAVPEEWNSEMQNSVVLRFPMKAALSSGEPEKNVSVALHNYEGVTNGSNKNWNLIGNPYLTSYAHENDEKLMAVGYYIPNPLGSGYIDTGEKLRYLTWSLDGHRSYIQKRITETSMSSFRTYFVQAAVDGVLNFSLSRRANAPHRQWMASEPEQETANKEYELGVTLANDSISDGTGLLYGELFTQSYEMNADLVKMFGTNQPMSFYSIGANSEPRAYNALPLADAQQPVPLGFRNAPLGTMQVAFDTIHYDASLFDAVWLLDYETGNTINLIDEPYIFMNKQTSSDTRLALFAIPAVEQDTPTGTDIVSSDVQGVEVYDMLGRRVNTKLVDLPQGVYVVVENGIPRKEVVK